MASLLITRPEPAASRTAARLGALGHQTLIAPFLRIIPLSPALPPGAAACLLTSANALHALPSGMPVFAVGEGTAQRARSRTTAAVYAGGGDAAGLAALVAEVQSPAAGPLLLLSGVGQGMRLAADLRRRGFTLLRRAAYHARPVARFPADAAAALAAGSIDSVLFYSGATARAFSALLPDLLSLAAVRAVALSEAVAQGLEARRWGGLEIAAAPDEAALIEIL